MLLKEWRTCKQPPPSVYSWDKMLSFHGFNQTQSWFKIGKLRLTSICSEYVVDGTKSHTLGLQSALKLTLELIQEILNAKFPIG